MSSSFPPIAPVWSVCRFACSSCTRSPVGRFCLSSGIILSNSVRGMLAGVEVEFELTIEFKYKSERTSKPQFNLSSEPKFEIDIKIEV